MIINKLYIINKSQFIITGTCNNIKNNDFADFHIVINTTINFIKNKRINLNKIINIVEKLMGIKAIYSEFCDIIKDNKILKYKEISRLGL